MADADGGCGWENADGKVWMEKKLYIKNYGKKIYKIKNEFKEE